VLTGKRLFRGDDDNDVQVLGRILQGCTDRPSDYAPAIPPALDAVTMRGLDVNTLARFATAREMATALERAVPMATVSEVGDWVTDAARETLDERSAKIASMETDSAIYTTAPPRDDPPPQVPASGSFSQRMELPATAIERVPPPQSNASPSPQLPKRRVWPVLVGASLLVVLGFVAGVLRPWTKLKTPAIDLAPSATKITTAAATATETASSTATPTSTATAAAAQAMPSAVPATTESASASATPAESAPSIAPAAHGPPGSVTHVTTRPGPGATPPSSKDCDPPYTLDDQGRKYFKPECFKQ
jgi:serine/threonine-protein kinase